jgi:hypothetical protein
MLVGVPLLIVAFSVTRPEPLPPPPLPPQFSERDAIRSANELVTRFPDRTPGSSGADGAAAWLEQQLALFGLRAQTDAWEEEVAGLGRVRLQNIVAVVPGLSRQAIVVMAHRDDVGLGAGANDNGSGVAAWIELARAYTNPRRAGGIVGTGRGVRPSRTIVFLSTDGGAWGGIGAERFAATSPHARSVVAVLNLDAIAGAGRARLELTGDTARSPANGLVRTAAERLLAEAGDPPRRARAIEQLVDLGFPFSLYEQAPFVARGIPAVTFTTAASRPPPAFGDNPQLLRGRRLGQIGRAAQSVLASLDAGAELPRGGGSYLYLGSRIVRGWAIEIVLVALLLPVLFTTVDLFARCRRRRIPIAPAFRSYRSRLAFWLIGGGLFALLALLGAWGQGAARPPNPEVPATTEWPAIAVAVFAFAMIAVWFIVRERLLPRRAISAEEELAGQTAALVALSGVGVLVVAVNPYALIFVLPSLHAWLWLPQFRHRPALARVALLAVGLTGPALLLWSFAARLELGFDAPLYVAKLFALGYAPAAVAVIALAWAAAGAQLAAASVGRYAPYPDASERGPRGPIRELIRKIVLALRARRRVTPLEDEALEL